eukprot:TRINITY_DN13455_c0_g1_i1.p1 TRINITY_DN13455_c0_g1~~TRINITY_DN13455_c0_g1_i1.p1  ORF type:complete len:764 (+),score=172.93 TRINITY_DN13455_c0_g1_i1:145-2436(+)
MAPTSRGSVSHLFHLVRRRSGAKSGAAFTKTLVRLSALLLALGCCAQLAGTCLQFCSPRLSVVNQFSEGLWRRRSRARVVRRAEEEDSQQAGGDKGGENAGGSEEPIFEDLFEEFSYLDEKGEGGSGTLDSDDQAMARGIAYNKVGDRSFKKMQAIEQASAAMQEVAEFDPEFQKMLDEELEDMDGGGGGAKGEDPDVSDSEVDEFLDELRGSDMVERPEGGTPMDAFGRDSKRAIDLFSELKAVPERQLIYARGMPDQQALLTVKDRIQLVSQYANQGNWKRSRFFMSGLWRKKKLRLPLGRVLWNLMIKAHVKARRPKAAEMWLKDMLDRVYQPDIYSYNTLLSGYAKNGDYLKVRTWMRRMAARGVRPDMWSYTALANAYVEAGSLEGVERTVDEMEEAGVRAQNAYAYNAILKVCSWGGLLEKAEAWMERLKKRKWANPDRVSYLLMIKTAAGAKDAERAAHWIQQMEQAGHEPGRPHIHAVMVAHAKKGDLDGAEAWLRVLESRDMPADAYSYNILISAAAQLGDQKAAEDIVLRMQAAGVTPDVVTHSSMIGALAEANNASGALAWLYMAEDNELEPDLACYNQAIKAFSRAGNSTGAEHLARRLLRHSHTPDVYTYNSLLGALAKDGNPAQAEFWLDHMQRSARHRHTQFPVDQLALAYQHVLTAYVRSGNLEAAEAWHSQMLGEGIEPNPRCYLTLIRGYLDQGSIASARRWLERMSTWSSYTPPQRLVDTLKEGDAALLEEASTVAALAEVSET